jgi:two-component system, chemotaxis family, protein-glutamate methylesterase/glutaminase
MSNQKPISVMIVDDSIIIRGILSRILKESPPIEVVGAAIDGHAAISMAAQLQPDIILLDINMPRKDGITALPELKEVSPRSKIVIASTATTQNAQLALKALELGASECLNMPNPKLKDDIDRFARDLVSCIYALTGNTPRNGAHFAPAPSAQRESIPSAAPIFSPMSNTPHRLRALAIGSSTGGPQALAHLFKQLKGRIPHVPIFITQHMPATFTTILATNLASSSGITCKEGKEGDIVEAGRIYVAPGDYHMTLSGEGEKVTVHLNQGAMENYCRPSVEPMLRSLINVYRNQMMFVMLTGMGHDGIEAAKTLHTTGGLIVAQDKESSVVWGMPKAIADAGIAQAVLPLDNIADYIVNAFQKGGSHAKS